LEPDGSHAVVVVVAVLQIQFRLIGVQRRLLGQGARIELLPEPRERRNKRNNTRNSLVSSGRCLSARMVGMERNVEKWTNERENNPTRRPPLHY
jgi:hypothetical protein